jgi:hypothetical protein
MLKVVSVAFVIYFSGEGDLNVKTQIREFIMVLIFYVGL